MKLENSAPLASLFTAIAASLCCITPVVAFVAGTSGLASAFSWIEPARPYLLGVTALALGFAWYQKLKPIPADNCGCAPSPKRPFLKTRAFLLFITVFTVITSAFPLYAGIFFPKTENNTIVSDQKHVEKVEFTIQGMTCTACENHVKAEIEKLHGIVGVAVSYKKNMAVIQFDRSQSSTSDIQKAIEVTGYKVVHQQNLAR